MPGKTRKSQKAWKAAPLSYAYSIKPLTLNPLWVLGVLSIMQSCNVMTSPLFLRAVEGEPESGHCSAETFYLNRDVLHCKQRSQTRLVPKTMRNLVLASGYSIPCAGHFRKSKQFPDLKKQKNLAWLLLFRPILQKLPSVSEDIQQSPIQSFTLPFELSIWAVGNGHYCWKKQSRKPLHVSHNRLCQKISSPVSIKAKSVASFLLKFFSRAGFLHGDPNSLWNHFMSNHEHQASGHQEF